MTRPPASPIEPGRRVGAGKEAEVFALGEEVLKLYRSHAAKDAPFREAAILALVERAGLPAPRVSSVGAFAGRWGLVMSRVDGPTLAETIACAPDGPGAHLTGMALLQRRLHAEPGSGLPGLKARLADNIAGIGRPGARWRALVDGLARMPDDDCLCHGDFHPLNILWPADGPVVVDWLDACRGAPAADACRSWVLMRARTPELADAYLAAYLRVSGLRSAAVRAWLPYVAAARLAEGVEEEADALVRMAEAPQNFLR
jgi:Ser/Thr protein kinase RdoA (MazF antagonist)